MGALPLPQGYPVAIANILICDSISLFVKENYGSVSKAAKWGKQPFIPQRPSCLTCQNQFHPFLKDKYAFPTISTNPFSLTETIYLEKIAI